MSYIKTSKKFSFVVISLLSLIGYGVFVFAAPPGPGGYNPGETLDPECTPGQLAPEPCIVQLTSGGSSGWSLSGNTVTGGVAASIDTVFNGVGLNDITITGPFTGDTLATWVIVITATGTPDQMEVIINGDVEYSGDVFPPGPFPVDDGLTLNFGSDTGHTIGDSWEFTMTPASGGTTAFLGTLNNEDLVFKTNNTEWIRLSAVGNLNLSSYISSRDNSGVTSPTNFLYTDGSGNLLSAPTSLLGGGSFSLTLQDEGSTLTTSTNTINFTGAGVTATDSGGGVVTVDIPSGSGDGNIYDNDGTLSSGRYVYLDTHTLNFQGGGFNVSGSSDTSTPLSLAGTNMTSNHEGVTIGGTNNAFSAPALSFFGYNSGSGSDIEIYPFNQKLKILNLATDNTGDQVLAKDSLGNSVWRDVSSLGGGSDTSIYLNDGTLTGNRALDADGNNLTFSNLDQLTFSTQSGNSGIIMSDKGSGYGVVLLQGQELISSDDHRSQISTDIGDGNYDADFDDLHLGLVDVSSIADNGAAIEVNATTGVRFRFRNSGVMSNYFFPRTDGTATQILSTDGSGQISWVDKPQALIGRTSGIISNPTPGVSTETYLGNGAGGSNTSNTTMIGVLAGANTAANFQSTFIGSNAGNDANSASDSFFGGYYAGYNADGANNSVFLGVNSGRDATNALQSNFIGSLAGYQATNARRSIFIGTSAGLSDLVDNSTSLNDFSILIGHSTSTGGFSNSIAIGGLATNTASNQFMIGSATRPINDTIITGTGSFRLPIGTDGQRTGSPASGMIRFSSTNDCYEGYKTSGSAWSCFSTGSAGWSLTGNSGTTAGTNFIGTTDAEDFVIKVNGNEMARFYESTGSSERSISFGGGVVTASDMFVYGNDAGLGSIGASGSIFMGIFAGKNSNGANNSFFIGSAAGENSSSISSIFFGQQAGKDTAVVASNFIGLLAGQNATNASNSNFIGRYAGESATDASESNFIGYYAGQGATDASESIFIGHYTGASSLNASKSVFIGRQAGYNAAAAANSIFLGDNAGNNDGADNTTDPDDFSILIGNNTSTGGFSNSIALGAYATNTASNQFMIGSATRPIDTTRINGSASTQCTITTGTGIACTSDERVKTNITDLTNDTLDKLLNVKTVSYNWLQNPTSKTQIGFLAQDLEQYFPELVETDSVGMKSVYYAQMTPILVEAIREMNLNVTMLSDMTRDNTWRDALIAWFGNAANGIENFIAGTIKARTQVCIDDVCINKEQLQSILQNNGIVNQPSPIIVTPPPTDDPVIDNTTDDTVTDPDTDTNTPSEELPVSTDDTGSADNSEQPTTE